MAKGREDKWISSMELNWISKGGQGMWDGREARCGVLSVRFRSHPGQL
eukprot:CAMPEP_0167793360 /NCGR_PEP_ID=MMETSP0111_2-20121227/13129_1 /TAXON_ID=91324 /ORGANISM="Lotharella globosa, Strain CCCM811" /LENGTH=47 /DNA_ID= /DNA_START= /DNA_END= /DNA_ORIENTATION=